MLVLYRVSLEIFQVAELECEHVGGREYHPRRDSSLECLLPPWGAQAPAVSGLETWEVPFRVRCGKVIPACRTEGQELIGDLGAHGVHPGITLAGVAGPVSEVARERLVGAAL